MKILFALICLLLVVQLVYPFATVLLASILYRIRATGNKPIKDPVIQYDFACIITAYRNAAIAQPLVESLLRQTHTNFTIYLVADECPDFEFGISAEQFVLLRPAEALRLKVKSILHAVENFRRSPDFIAVFDADNLAHPQFLERVNEFAHAGYQCIQGQRMAKNLDTPYAALDSLGEHYKNYIEREIPFRLGGSAVISGSGMATETGVYKAYLSSPEIEQGKHQWKKMLQEDKILQNFLLRSAVRIAYAREAILFDEKVESGTAVETQRSRWLFSYFQNIPNALGILRRGCTGMSFNQIYFGFVTLVLPMFIQLGLALSLAFLALFISPVWTVALIGSMAIFTLNLLWVLYLDDAPPEVWRALWQVPRFVWRQFKGLLKMSDPNKNFQHTTHGKILSIDEVLSKKTNPDQEL